MEKGEDGWVVLNRHRLVLSLLITTVTFLSCLIKLWVGVYVFLGCDGWRSIGHRLRVTVRDSKSNNYATRHDVE